MTTRTSYVAGERPNEEVINDSIIIKRNNFKKINVPQGGLLPALEGYSFTEKIYKPSEYIRELEQQITDLQLVIVSLYEEEN